MLSYQSDRSGEMASLQVCACHGLCWWYVYVTSCTFSTGCKVCVNINGGSVLQELCQVPMSVPSVCAYLSCKEWTLWYFSWFSSRNNSLTTWIRASWSGTKTKIQFLASTVNKNQQYAGNMKCPWIVSYPDPPRKWKRERVWCFERLFLPQLPDLRARIRLQNA